ncbi:MAG: FecR domain-containing protein [Lentisphaeraceae bacterium]|nr:FecR domain-containing protein [Lentisphaeraceae bacterium]
MNKEDIDLIERFIEGQLSDAEIKDFNVRMEDEDFRQFYVNHLLDDRLINKALQAEIPEQEVKTVRYSNLNVNKSYFWHYLITAAAALTIAFLMLGEKPIAKVASYKGKAKATQLGSPISLHKGMDIYKGDTIETLDGAVDFIYPDGTTISIEPHSQISLDIDSGKKLLFLEKGQFTADVKPQQEDKEMIVKTNTSVAKILGTKFVLDSKSSKSNLEVLKGKVHFHNTTGSEDYVISGEIAQAKFDAPVISQKKFISEQKRKLDQVRYDKWLSYSEKFKNDPLTLAYYDFEGISKDSVETLRNKAIATQGLPLDGEIITTLPMKGRWAQKGALYFSEYGYVNFETHEAYNLPGPISIFAWMRVKKFYRGWQTIISKGDNTWRLARNRQHNYLEFCCNGIKPQHVLIGKQDVNDKKWHLIVGTYDGEHIKLYIDGKLDASLPASGRVNGDDYPVNIGANSRHKNRDFEGWIDELGILKRALSEEEIKEMYHIGKPAE